MEPEEKSAASARMGGNNKGNAPSTPARNGETGAVHAPPPRAPDGAQDSEDMAIAEETEEKYNVRGIKDTIPYSEYRSRRLDTKS